MDRNICICLCVVLLILALPNIVRANDFSGQLVKVTDGDTVQVLHDGKEEKVRLEGIDCPEMGQAYGRKAKQYVIEIAAGKIVKVQATGKDRYGRTLGNVILPDGKNLNHQLVKEGFAWWFQKYSNDIILRDLEKEARDNKRGLWTDTKPIAPWEWRKMKRAGKL